jgi:hypothetical protein
MLMLVVETVD